MIFPLTTIIATQWLTSKSNASAELLSAAHLQTALRFVKDAMHDLINTKRDKDRRGGTKFVRPGPLEDLVHALQVPA